MPFVPQSSARLRAAPLGPETVNQAQTNIEETDALALVEHFNDGQHNALEVPWILGHMADGSPPTGYLFDTAFGGGTLARPATGAYTINAVAGVVSTSDVGDLQFSGMANVADAAIETKPHTVTLEAVSATSMKLRVRELSSALGAGNAWADVNRNLDFALHALPQAADASLLVTHSLKRRRDTLTEAANDWNALVSNQGIVRKASLLEHTSAGVHNVNRIARAVAWCRPSAGPAFSLTYSDGVSAISRVSSGIVELTLSTDLAATTGMACFPEGQPASADELVIVNGRGFNSGAGTTKFRFYIYVYSGGNWARADRAFFAAMFGAP